MWLQAALTAAISSVSAAIFALLLWLDQPFWGGVRVDLKPFGTLRATTSEAVGAASGPPRKQPGRAGSVCGHAGDAM